MSKGDPVLLATTIFVLQDGGNYKQFHRGEAVPGLNDEQVERLTKCGALGAAADLKPEPAEVVDTVERNGAGVPTGEEAEAGGDKPAADANKPELVEWIYQNVAKEDGSDYTKTELRKMDRAELWVIINSVED